MPAKPGCACRGSNRGSIGVVQPGNPGGASARSRLSAAMASSGRPRATDDMAESSAASSSRPPRASSAMDAPASWREACASAGLPAAEVPMFTVVANGPEPGPDWCSEPGAAGEPRQLWFDPALEYCESRFVRSKA